MQKIFRKVDSWEEILDMPEGWKAEKAGDPSIPQEWNIMQKYTLRFKQIQFTTHPQFFEKVINISQI